jgi:hypothetical protein
MIGVRSHAQSVGEVGAMGELVRFRAAAGPRKDSADRSDNAQILLFTGVRYQRSADVSPKVQAGDSDAPPSGGVGGAGGGRRKRRG